MPPAEVGLDLGNAVVLEDGLLPPAPPSYTTANASTGASASADDAESAVSPPKNAAALARARASRTSISGSKPSPAGAGDRSSLLGSTDASSDHAGQFTEAPELAELSSGLQSTSLREDSSGLSRQKSFASGAVVEKEQSTTDITDMLSQEMSGLGKTANVEDFVFQFVCERKKCRAEMSISGQAMREAAQQVRESKKWKKKGGPILVEVACAKCGKLHNLAAPDGSLS